MTKNKNIKKLPPKDVIEVCDKVIAKAKEIRDDEIKCGDQRNWHFFNGKVEAAQYIRANIKLWDETFNE